MNPASSKPVRLPAEWEPQDAVMVTWPGHDSNWGDTITRVEPTLVTLINEISLRERVIVACADVPHVQALLEADAGNKDRISLYPVRSNDLWARDHGPITVYEDDEARLLNFRFNGWGCKYPYALDNKINERLAEAGAWSSAKMWTLDLVFEGGAIESDGQGTLLLNSQCVLHPSRNGNMPQAEVEAKLREYFGAERILWVHHGHLEGDDTDGHIDTLARFCSPDIIAYTACADTDAPHFRQLQAMESELKRLRTSDGRPYTLVPLPLPAPVYDEAGEQLPANYANFLLINGAVLLPTYADPNDAVAGQRIQELFPDRRIVPIDCREVITQYGAIHCMTMQIPLGGVAKNGHRIRGDA